MQVRKAMDPFLDDSDTATYRYYRSHRYKNQVIAVLYVPSSTKLATEHWRRAWEELIKVGLISEDSHNLMLPYGP